VKVFTGQSDSNYTLTQAAAKGYKLTSISCTNSAGAPVGTVDLAAGSVTGLDVLTDRQIHCTFVSGKGGDLYFPIIFKNGTP